MDRDKLLELGEVEQGLAARAGADIKVRPLGTERHCVNEVLYRTSKLSSPTPSFLRRTNFAF